MFASGLMFFFRLHDAVICVFDEAGSVIDPVGVI
jgi:hypothetical protein